MTYKVIKLNLTQGQAKKVAKAMKDISPVSVRVSPEQLKGKGEQVELVVTTMDYSKIEKNRNASKGFILKLSKKEIVETRKHYKAIGKKIDKDEMQGGLGPLGVALLSPVVAQGASRVMDKILGKGLYMPYEGSGDPEKPKEEATTKPDEPKENYLSDEYIDVLIDMLKKKKSLNK